jgi:hypothetical protein
MSVEDETWDRPICQICGKQIGYAKQREHGKGICDQTVITTVTWYVARNHLGEFSRGEKWVKDIAKARFHKKVGPVRTAITKWTKRHPDLPVPQILEWKCDIATARIMDETARTENAISRMKRRAVERQMRDAKFKREMLEREIARHQEELRKLHERNATTV